MAAIEGGRTMGVGEARDVLDTKTGEFGNFVRTVLIEAARGLGEDFPQREVAVDGKLVDDYSAIVLFGSPMIYSAVVWVPDDRCLIVAPYTWFSGQKAVPEVGQRAKIATMKVYAEHGPKAINGLDFLMQNSQSPAPSLQQG